jgi:hypothetical protein
MTAPISLRGDFDGPMLRALALSEKAGSVTRRLLALVTIYDGGTRADAARLGGVGLQTLIASSRHDLVIMSMKRRPSRPLKNGSSGNRVGDF